MSIGPAPAGHERLHELAGAFVLGGLDEADHRAFTRHLRECALCQREIGQLSGVPRLLDLVDGPTVESLGDEALETGAAQLGASAAGAAPALAPPEVGALVLALRRAKRRSRIRTAAAAAVLAVACVGGGVLWGQASARPPAPSVTLTAAPASGSSTAARVGLVTKGWGTQVEVAASELPRTGTFTLTVIDVNGQETTIGSWSATPSGQATLIAPCSWTPASIRAVHVRTGAGQLLAVATA